jgi:hypothetical protein
VGQRRLELRVYTGGGISLFQLGYRRHQALWDKPPSKIAEASTLIRVDTVLVRLGRTLRNHRTLASIVYPTVRKIAEPLN